MGFSNPSQIRVLATPGFLREAEKHGGAQGFIAEPLKLLMEALSKQPSQPSWVVVEPGLPTTQNEDEGRTRKMPGVFRYWAIRDDHSSDCTCGCSGQSVVTFLLPEDY